MNEVPPLGQDDERVFQQLLAHYDAPAFLRRARLTQNAYEDLVNRCRQQRDEWLEPVRKRLGALRTLVQDWSDLQPWLADAEQVQVLRSLEETLRPLPSSDPDPVWFGSLERRALHELCARVEWFNRRWQSFLASLDLSHVNALRDGYNRWYVLEKECAVRSARVARQGFQPLPPVTREEIAAAFPLLPLPTL